MKTQKDFNSYTLLTQLCKIRNLQSSYSPLENPITPRAEFIIQTLKDIGKRVNLDYFDGSRSHSYYKLNEEKTKAKQLQKKQKAIIDTSSLLAFEQAETEEEINELLDRMNSVFNSKFDMSLYDIVVEDIKGQYANIEVKFSAKKKTDNTIIYIAHHDIANENSDNCNDNSASVCNLLQLASELKGQKLDKNIYIVFTDCEEFGGRGARQLSNKINKGEFGNVEYVVNLELSAVGRHIWVESDWKNDKSRLIEKLKEVQETYNEFKVPFNDSVILRKNNIDSICIGTITNEDLFYLTDIKTKGRGCRTWAVCHNEFDKFELANKNDMIEFVKFLHLLK